MGEIFSNTFLMAQIFGLCALCCSITAWQLKNPRHIILFYVPIGFLWGVQYYLLGAYAAMSICALAIVKDAFVGYLPARYGRYAVVAFLITAFAVILNLYQSWIDLLPFFASTIMNIGLLFPDNRKFVTRMGIAHQIVWISYNIPVAAYMGIFCSVMITVSTIISMARYERWEIGKCYRTFLPSIARSLFPNFRTYP